MNYHLNQQGQAVGVFPLEELRRRRQAGELTGAELVWREGMTHWQPLDAVLQHKSLGSIPTPPHLPVKKQKKAPVALILSAIAAVVALVVLFGYLALRVVRDVQPIREVVNEISTGSGGFNRESALVVASKPVQWTTNTETVAQWLQRSREFRIRQYLGPYEKYGDDSKDAHQLIAQWIDFSFGERTQTNSVSLEEMSENLATNSATEDPVVWTAIGANTPEMQEKVRRLEKAVKGYERSQYPEYPQLYARVLLANTIVELHGDHGRVKQLDDSSAQLLKAALQDGSIRPEDLPQISDVLINTWGRGFLNREGGIVVSAAQAAGKPYQWLALVLEGEHQVMEAWKARGDGYADTVTKEGWKGFNDHLAKARENFDKAWRLRPDLSEAPYQMMNVALGTSDLPEMRTWFDRVVSIQIDHSGAWNQMRWGLRPRWYGNFDSMLAFGVMAANTRRYDTDVPRRLFDSVSDLEQEMKLPVGEHIYGRDDIWPHLQKMYEGYIAEPSQAKLRDGWRSTYAVIAFLAGKYDVAREQLETLQWQPWPGNLRGYGRDLSLLPQEVAARTGLVGSQVASAETQRKDGHYASALAIYKALSTADKIDERTLAFVRDRLTTVELEQRLQSGDWVSFLPQDESLMGWKVDRGKFTSQPDGALVAESDSTGHIVFSRARVGADFEVRGTFEVVSSSTTSFQAGVVMGLPQFGADVWCSFRVKRNADEGDVVSFAEGWGTRQIVRSTHLNNETNSFYFRIQHGVVTASVNEKEIFHRANPPKHVSIPTSESHLGLGAFNDMNHTIIRYRDVQVRKLSP